MALLKLKSLYEQFSLTLFSGIVVRKNIDQRSFVVRDIDIKQRTNGNFCTIASGFVMLKGKYSLYNGFPQAMK